MPRNKPNILYFHVDNIGLGELGCYSGGLLRGADTARIDQFAAEGLKLWHFVAEAQCTPSRSALMTGRYPIRSGTHTVALAGEEGGLVAWERTMADMLSDAGYATSCLGKWHIGASEGRWPTDHGFDEFYGPPRSYDECFWVDDPWYDEKRDPVTYMYEARKGEPARELTDQQLTPARRRDVDAEYLKRAFDFIDRSVKDDRPFYLYFNHSLMHIPLTPRKEFEGKSGEGENADCLLELDHDFGALLDHLEKHGLTDNTIVVFAGDNGPEEMLLYRGSPGPYDGSYFASREGGLRTPCLVRWPGKVAADRESNELVHITDMYTTLLTWAGCGVPQDREIDGVDQGSFFSGQTEESGREGSIVWVGPRMHAVKWRHFKFQLIDQKYFFDPVAPSGFPMVRNLITDPKEREPINHRHFHTWTMAHFGRLLGEYEESVKREPLIPAGAPLDYVPRREK